MPLGENVEDEQQTSVVPDFSEIEDIIQNYRISRGKRWGLIGSTALVVLLIFNFAGLFFGGLSFLAGIFLACAAGSLSGMIPVIMVGVLAIFLARKFINHWAEEKAIDRTIIAALQQAKEDTNIEKVIQNLGGSNKKNQLPMFPEQASQVLKNTDVKARLRVAGLQQNDALKINCPPPSGIEASSFSTLNKQTKLLVRRLCLLLVAAYQMNPSQPLPILQNIMDQIKEKVTIDLGNYSNTAHEFANALSKEEAYASCTLADVQATKKAVLADGASSISEPLSQALQNFKPTKECVTHSVPSPEAPTSPSTDSAKSVR